MIKAIILVFLLSSTATGYTQKTMALPDSFLANSQLLKVTQKNISGFPKYEIGNYKVISGRPSWMTFTRQGWTDQSFLSYLLFTKEEKVTINEKSSFVLAGPNNDTAFVTIATYTTLAFRDASKHRIKAARSPKEYSGGLANYIAVIHTNTDTITWTLNTIVTETPQGNLLGLSEKKYTFRGMLTDGKRQIELKETDRFKDGKSSIIPGLLGLTFNEDKIVAALQFHTTSFKKDSRHFAWLASGLESDFQLILTAAAVALLARESAMEVRELEYPAN